MKILLAFFFGFAGGVVGGATFLWVCFWQIEREEKANIARGKDTVAK